MECFETLNEHLHLIIVKFIGKIISVKDEVDDRKSIVIDYIQMCVHKLKQLFVSPIHGAEEGRAKKMWKESAVEHTATNLSSVLRALGPTIHGLRHMLRSSYVHACCK